MSTVPISFTGTASLVDELDSRVMVVLRDGRHLVGKLVSFDHFSSIVLEDSVQRHFGGGMYFDEPLGVFVIRGENLVLISPIDEEKEDAHPFLRPASRDEVLDAIEKEEEEAKARQAPLRSELWQMGETDQ